MIDLAGKVALVTGASAGIGRAITIRLAREGMRLILAARDAERLQRVRDEALEMSGGHGDPEGIVTCPADIADDGDLARLGDAATERFGRLDLLVHCAGIYTRGRLDEASLGDLDRQYATNIRGPYALTQRLLPLLVLNEGQIVFINSTQGLNAGDGVGQYAATQHALKAIADSLRQEINGQGVRVLTIHPGRTATPRQERIFALEHRPYTPQMLMQPDDVAEILTAAVRLPRSAEVTEIMMRPMRKLQPVPAVDPAEPARTTAAEVA